jgi:hypothetical protein
MKPKYLPGNIVKIKRIDDALTSPGLVGFVGTVGEVEQLANGQYNYDVDGHYMHEGELEDYPDTRRIKLQEHPFFLDFINPGMVYEGGSPDKELSIMVKLGRYNDWAAYNETPWCHGRVAELGAKMPEAVAKFFFPEVGKNRKYRP